jgi:hypothetical protein
MPIAGIYGPVRTPKGHLAFPHLLAPETAGKFPSNKYVTTFLIKKDENLTALIDACVKAAQQEWPTIGITGPAQIKLGLRKGTEKPGWEDYIFLKAKTKTKPPIVDARKVAFTGAPKGGDICYLALSAMAYKQQLEAEVAEALRAAGKLVQEGTVVENGVTKRVSWRPATTFLLNGVQWLEAHAPIGGAGGVDGTTAFAEEAPAAAAASGDAADLFT